MSSATTAWKDATQACLKFLASELGYQENKTAFMGDTLPDDKAGLFVFLINDGPEQVQNYQVPTPAFGWLAMAQLQAQFMDIDKAFNFGGQIQNIMPAYKDKNYAGQPGGHVQYRGIPPNVKLFEMTRHPRLYSRIIELGGKTPKHITFYVVEVFFRVQYTDTKN